MPRTRSDDRTVGLILRERLLQQLVRLLGAHLVHQVDRHVVRRRERAAQRERAGRRQPGDLRRFRGLLAGMPEHHRVTLDVDAASAGPPGELRVLPRRQRHVLLAVELHQPLQHHRAGRHVDAQCQGLGGEHRPDQAGGEQLLDRVPEYRQHPGVMGRQRRAAAPPATRSSRAPPGRSPSRSPQRWSITSAIWARSSSVVSRSDERRHCWTAASQPTRENTKVIAGSSPSASSDAITSGRDGGR